MAALINPRKRQIRDDERLAVNCKARPQQRARQGSRANRGAFRRLPLLLSPDDPVSYSIVTFQILDAPVWFLRVLPVTMVQFLFGLCNGASPVPDMLVAYKASPRLLLTQTQYHSLPATVNIIFSCPHLHTSFTQYKSSFC